LARRRAREIALQVLFQVDMGHSRPEQALEYTLEEFPVNSDTASFATMLVGGTLSHLPEIDRMLKEHATDWALPRMGNVDRNILRLGLYEILYQDGTPLNVAIDEALGLAKRFSDNNAPRFINGVLGKIAKELPVAPGLEF
jgi:N utilization substance protein B